MTITPKNRNDIIDAYTERMVQEMPMSLLEGIVKDIMTARCHIMTDSVLEEEIMAACDSIIVEYSQRGM